MLKFSKKIEYALISMLFMADREKGELTTSRELSENFNIPQELVGKVLQKLAKNGCVTSVQGVKGGYQLLLPPEMVSLSRVIRAVEGPIRIVNCVNEPESCTCDQLNYCNMRNPMETIQYKLTQFLNSITLKDLQANSTPFEPRLSKKGSAINVISNLPDQVN